MANGDIDRVVLLLSECPNVEIRDVNRRIGKVCVKAINLNEISEIPQVLRVEVDTKFYINRIAII